MIPKLSQNGSLSQTHKDFIEALQNSTFGGEVETQLSSRLVASTDNSIYQVLPQAVLLPRSKSDISTIFTLARDERFRQLKFTPRGGGTGTNGQSLSNGFLVDASKHMNKVLEVNEKEGWARVQPGVVLDQLNQQIKATGLFFAPDLSPSNRATIGGMCNTDACGKGSRVYGKTSNHLLELELILSDGSAMDSSPLSEQELSDKQARSDMAGAIHRDVHRIVINNKDLIENTFPKLTRFLSGYNLAHVIDEDGKFNLNYLIAGSEGTLAFVSELKIRLCPIPKRKHLFWQNIEALTIV